MKKSILAILASFSIIFAQTRDVITERYENGMKKVIIVYEGEGRNEKIVEQLMYYENGQLLGSVGIKNGERNGRLIEYYSNGDIKSETNWKNDHEIGLSKSYYENGNLKYSTNYDNNGKRIGEAKIYHQNGNIKEVYSDKYINIYENLNSEEYISLIKKYFYNEDSRNDVLRGYYEYYRGYYDEGNDSLSIDVDGNIISIVDFFRNGVIKKKRTLDRSLKNYFGEYQENYSNGNVKRKKTINSKGVMEGIYLECKENGDTLTYYYKNGEQYVGAFKESYDNGNLKILTHYNEDGQVDGNYIEYFESGDTLQYYHMDNGVLNGRYVAFYSNKQIKERAYYKDGNAIGNHEVFDRLGNFISFIQYGEKNEDDIREVQTRNSDGLLIEKYSEKDGKKHGKYYQYDSFGILRRDVDYVDGLIHGKVIQYHSKDQIHFITNYQNGVTHGLSIIYDTKGRVIDQYKFESGKLIKK